MERAISDVYEAGAHPLVTKMGKGIIFVNNERKGNYPSEKSYIYMAYGSPSGPLSPSSYKYNSPYDTLDVIDKT